MVTAFNYQKDFVTPQSVLKTALAVAERARDQELFTPEAAGAFDHSTTSVSTVILPDLAISLTSGSTIADLIAASTKIIDRLNEMNGLINRVVYNLEANGLTS